jgi:hypothetical protein
MYDVNAEKFKVLHDTCEIFYAHAIMDMFDDELSMITHGGSPAQEFADRGYASTNVLELVCQCQLRKLSDFSNDLTREVAVEMEVEDHKEKYMQKDLPELYEMAQKEGIKLDIPRDQIKLDRLMDDISNPIFVGPGLQTVEEFMKDEGGDAYKAPLVDKLLPPTNKAHVVPATYAYKATIIELLVKDDQNHEILSRLKQYLNTIPQHQQVSLASKPDLPWSRRSNPTLLHVFFKSGRTVHLNIKPRKLTRNPPPNVCVSDMVVSHAAHFNFQIFGVINQYRLTELLCRRHL